MSSHFAATSKPIFKAGAIVGGCLLVGFLLSLLKGTGGGARLQFGNLSAPWLLIPLLTGVAASRVFRGALTGVTATVVALLGFYAQQSPIADFSMGSLHFLADPALAYRFLVGAHYIYFVAGLIAGALFGALGVILSRHSRSGLLAVAAVLLVGEPFVTLLTDAARGVVGSAHTPWLLWGAEVTVGLVVATLGLRMRSRAAS